MFSVRDMSQAPENFLSLHASQFRLLLSLFSDQPFTAAWVSSLLRTQIQEMGRTFQIYLFYYCNIIALQCCAGFW